MPVLPYLTADLPGTGGLIKQRNEDFRVDELPLYPASGEGTHVYFRIEKRGIPTPEAVRRIARHLGVPRNQIGFAGMKDAQAVTTQQMSVEHVDPDRVAAYRDRQMRVVWTGRHTNKLRMGHLAANRFAIRIRDVDDAAVERARAILEVLAARGVPNYFGQQRFGARGDTADLGEALVRRDLQTFLSLLLGRPHPDDPPDCKAARDAFDAGAYARALNRWPRHYADQRRALAAYKKKQRPGPAVAAVDKRMKRLFVSAFQSAIFNDVLAQRIDTLDLLLVGDLAQKTDTGGVFLVEDPAAEQPRCDRFEISPTGPLPGSRASLAEGEPGRIERRALAEHGLGDGEIGRVGRLRVKGARRALRFALFDVSVSPADDAQSCLDLCFTCPSGCYATVALREVIKTADL